jgi:predicted dehydrogenase
MAADLGVPVFADLDAALAAVESEVVLLVSPPATRRALGETALAAGRHVVVEKPLALNAEDARALVLAGERAGRHVMVAQNYRFRRQSRALQALVATGALGRLLAVRISCRRDLRELQLPPHDWRRRMAQPYLFDMAVHHVDLLRMVTGLDVAEVDARAWRAPDADFDHELTLVGLLTLGDGTTVAYDGTWAATGRQTSWNGDWELVGEEGRATWTGGVADALRGTVTLGRYDEPPERVPLPRLAAVDRLGVLHELRRALAEGGTPECAAADNVRTLAAVLAAARSADERRPIAV